MNMSELEVIKGHLRPWAFVGIENESCRFRGRLFLFFNKQKCEIDLDIDIIALIQRLWTKLKFWLEVSSKHFDWCELNNPSQ